MTTDVLIIGAGPVGLTAALLLARFGLRVEVIERRLEPWSAPRAVAIDDEGLRVWQRCGLHEILREDWASGELGQCICTYLDEHRRPFLNIRQRLGEFGHPHAVAIHQGRIEAKLMEAVERTSGITLRRGCEVKHVEQADGSVTIRARGADGAMLERRALWAIACDGAGSAARECLGISMQGEELGHPWLVANLEDHGEPGHVTITCRPESAAVTMPIPHALRRVEVQLHADDPGDWLSNDAEVRRRLRLGWEGAAHATIVTRAICRFKAAAAERWREGRIFLAGDAAHLMPPFAGQGLGAGLRDVANITFKIAGVQQGWLGSWVLDSYEQERRPHVEKMTRLACRLGRLMMPRSSAEAVLVRSMLRLINALPVLGSRWLLRGPNIQQTISSGFIVPSRHAGRYLPQPVVLDAHGRKVLFDELLGLRMTWVVLAYRAGSTPDLPAQLFRPGDTVLLEERDFRDPGRLLRSRYGAGALVLVRPDRVVCVHLQPRRFQVRHNRRLACRPDIRSCGKNAVRRLRGHTHGVLALRMRRQQFESQCPDQFSAKRRARSVV